MDPKSLHARVVPALDVENHVLPGKQSIAQRPKSTSNLQLHAGPVNSYQVPRRTAFADVSNTGVPRPAQSRENDAPLMVTGDGSKQNVRVEGFDFARAPGLLPSGPAKGNAGKKANFVYRDVEQPQQSRTTEVYQFSGVTTTEPPSSLQVPQIPKHHKSQPALRTDDVEKTHDCGTQRFDKDVVDDLVHDEDGGDDSESSTHRSSQDAPLCTASKVIYRPAPNVRDMRHAYLYERDLIEQVSVTHPDENWYTEPIAPPVGWEMNAQIVHKQVKSVGVPRFTPHIMTELQAAAVITRNSVSPEELDEEIWDVSMVAEYGDEIFEYMKELEMRMIPKSNYMDYQNEIKWPMRMLLMDWLVQMHHKFNLLPETLFLAANYIDRFLSAKVVSAARLQLVGAAAILLAAKYEEINCPSLQEVEYMVDSAFTVDEIIKAERYMLSMLEFQMGWPGPMSFLRRTSKADDYDLNTRTMAKYLLEVTLMDERFIGSPPSYLAAAAHCLSRFLLRRGEWTPGHVHYSGYTYHQLKPAIETMANACRSTRPHHMTVYRKYLDGRFNRISEVAQNCLPGFRMPDSQPSPLEWFAFYDSVLQDGPNHSPLSKLPNPVEG